MAEFPHHWDFETILRRGLEEVLCHHENQNEKLEKIMADLTKLNASVDKLKSDVATLIASGQSDVDAVQAKVDAIDTDVVAQLPPATPTA